MAPARNTCEPPLFRIVMRTRGAREKEAARNDGPDRARLLHARDRDHSRFHIHVPGLGTKLFQWIQQRTVLSTPLHVIVTLVERKELSECQNTMIAIIRKGSTDHRHTRPATTMKEASEYRVARPARSRHSE